MRTPLMNNSANPYPRGRKSSGLMNESCSECARLDGREVNRTTVRSLTPVIGFVRSCDLPLRGTSPFAYHGTIATFASAPNKNNPDTYCQLKNRLHLGECHQVWDTRSVMKRTSRHIQTGHKSSCGVVSPHDSTLAFLVFTNKLFVLKCKIAGRDGIYYFKYFTEQLSLKKRACGRMTFRPRR